MNLSNRSLALISAVLLTAPGASLAQGRGRGHVEGSTPGHPEGLPGRRVGHREGDAVNRPARRGEREVVVRPGKRAKRVKEVRREKRVKRGDRRALLRQDRHGRHGEARRNLGRRTLERWRDSRRHHVVVKKAPRRVVVERPTRVIVKERPRKVIVQRPPRVIVKERPRKVIVHRPTRVIVKERPVQVIHRRPGVVVRPPAPCPVPVVYQEPVVYEQPVACGHDDCSQGACGYAAYPEPRHDGVQRAKVHTRNTLLGLGLANEMMNDGDSSRRDVRKVSLGLLALNEILR